MLLLYPPVAKPCEPPAGIAQLAGALRHHDHPCDVVDLNIEGLLFLLSREATVRDTWSARALKNLPANLSAIQTPELYRNASRYNKTVLEINRLLEIAEHPSAMVTLANYQDTRFSPLDSRDLLHIAEKPENSIFYTFYTKRIPELLEKSPHSYIGISLNYLSQALNTFALIGYLKKIAPSAKIVVGGGLITSWMRSPLWQNPFAGLIDHMIDGCGEIPLLKLLGTDIIEQSLPQYNTLCNNYFSPGFILPYSASTGCFWNKCSFCPEVAEKASYTGKYAERVVDEIRLLEKQTKPVLLHFLDNAIAPSLLSRMIDDPPGVNWYGFARVTEHLTDPEYCRKLRKSGCIMLKLGIESGSQMVLDHMKKGITVTVVSSVLQNLAEAGIATYVYLLFGTPSESYHEARKTLDFVQNHQKYITFVNLAIFNMPVNAAQGSTLEVTAFSKEDDLSLYTDFHHPLGWSRKEVRKFLDREFKRQPGIAAIIRRDPPVFTSNHAPFFVTP